MEDIPVQIVHHTGLKFQVRLQAAEIERFNTDENYAEQLLNKYYNLYLSGLVSSIDDDNLQTQESTQDSEAAVVNWTSEKRRWSSDYEEHLIKLVSERPPLFNFKLPLKERSRETVRSLWEEIISELNVDITVEIIAKKWKNIRDSFIRVRSNIKKKIASGSSAEEKLMAEKLKKNHKNYELLLFLDDTLSTKRTSSNLDELIENEDNSLMETPSMSRSSSRFSTNDRNNQMSAQDEAFLEAIKTLPGTTPLSPTQSFCTRLAYGMDKLPPRIRNQLELEFLQRLTEMENLYLYAE